MKRPVVKARRPILFYIHRSSSDACEIRVDFQERHAEEISPLERRAFMRLCPDLVVMNAWLVALAADAGYAAGTVYEYAKVLLYALEWLVQEPVNITTGKPVGHSLLSLSAGDLRSLFAWLDIPAHQQAERAYLVKTGMLPAGFRKNALAPTTHNLRAAALTGFYDWAIAEFSCEEGGHVELTQNPLKDTEHPLSHHQQMQRPDGQLPRSHYQDPEPSRLFRRRQNERGPISLTAGELHCVLDAIPSVSHGRNAANRNGALIRLLLWGMLRREELIEATWEAVNGETLWVVGKGSKRRAVPIADPGTWAYLQAYTNELGIPTTQRFHGALLRQIDHENRPITRHTVEHLMNALQKHFLDRAAQAGRENNHGEEQGLVNLSSKLHSHIFRATGATFMAKAGMSLIQLSLLLGHSDPTTTMRYYIAAEQLDLSSEVQHIFERISSALPVPSSLDGHHAPPNPRSWYRRRGLIP